MFEISSKGCVSPSKASDRESFEKSPVVAVVNTGSMTTKFSLYSQEKNNAGLLLNHTIEHPDTFIHQFPTIGKQVDLREKLVREFLDARLLPGQKLVAVGGIGGMLPPVPSGLIELNEALVDFSLNTPVYEHASNLGAPIAFRIAQTFGVRSFVADPVGVDEMAPIARISGVPDFPRFSFVHALNIRATVRKLALQLGKPFAGMRCVVAHLGGGFSIAPFDRGRIVDSDNRMEGAPFTPERAGGVPPIPLLDAAFSGRFTKKELHRKLYGAGGIYAYLGTKDIREVVRRIKSGDDLARFIYDAMIYQIAKEIGAMGSVLEFDLDGIILTGGVAHEEYLVNELTRKTQKMCPVFVFAGENENEAIAEGVARVLSGVEVALKWPDCIIPQEIIDPLFRWKDRLGKGV